MNDVLLDYHGLAYACHQFTKLHAALSPAYFGSSEQPTQGSSAIAAACLTSSIAKIRRCFPSVICSELWQVAARRESTLAATIAGLCSGHVAMPTSSTAYLCWRLLCLLYRNSVSAVTWQVIIADVASRTPDHRVYFIK